MMGCVVAAALITRHPAVTQSFRDGILGSLFLLTGLYTAMIWRMRPPAGLRWVLVWAGCLIVLYVFSTIYSPTPDTSALRPAGQLILVLAWLLFVYGTDREQSSRFAAFITLLAFLVIQSLLWARAGFPNPLTQAVALSASMLPKNTLGAFAAAALFFMFAHLGERRMSLARITGVVLAIALLWASGSRTPQLAVLVAGGVYLLWPFFIRSKWAYRAVFLSWLVAGTAFVYYYLSLSRSESMARVAIQEITGQGLYSGRELLWPSVLKYIGERPLLGWGAGLNESEVLLDGGIDPNVPGASTMNAHNLFLAVALKTGVVGLLLQLAMLCSIWLKFYSGRYNPTVRLAAACFMGICVHQLFETSLINTNLSIGVMFWCIIAIGLRSSDTAREYRGDGRRYHKAGEALPVGI
jgi:O-antigen ligase